jgi:hypothetical protein
MMFTAPHAILPYLYPLNHKVSKSVAESTAKLAIF